MKYHKLVRDRIPDFSDHRDGPCQRRGHAERLGQENREERVDDDKASSTQELAHSVGVLAEESVAGFSAADLTFHACVLLHL